MTGATEYRQIVQTLRLAKRKSQYVHITNGFHLSQGVPDCAQPKMLDIRCVPDVDAVRG